ncbi:MAG TPA: WbqC family protein [Gemmatimonadaceae bacterium]|nr:WbqC family protein [Gemmatimonadaceae bacterium]
MTNGQEKLVTIHQPDFMPWLGLFLKIAAADEWIVLDHVRNNPKTAAFWGRRVRMIINREPHWISVPLERGGDVFVPIKDMRLSSAASGAFVKLRRSIRESYSRSPFFGEGYPLFEAYLDHPSPYLIDRNMFFIEHVLSALRLVRPVVRSSLMDPAGTATDLLVDLLRKRNAACYVSGRGAEGYQDDARFEAAGIRLQMREDRAFTYPQVNVPAFVPGLSVLDSVMNIGFSGVANLLRPAGTAPMDHASETAAI